MDHCKNHDQDSASQAPQDVSINDLMSPLSSHPADSTVHKVNPGLSGPPRFPPFIRYFIRITQDSAQYVERTFCDGRLPLATPSSFPFALSLIPPLEDYIRLLFLVLTQEQFVKISMQTLLFLDRLHRAFPRARTVNPHGLYLATTICAAESGRAGVSEKLVRADTLFSRELIDGMTSEVERLLGGYPRSVSAAEVEKMWWVLCPDDPEDPGVPVDAALPCGNWGGGVAAVPMWSRLLCDEKDFSDQLHALGSSLEA